MKDNNLQQFLDYSKLFDANPKRFSLIYDEITKILQHFELVYLNDFDTNSQRSFVNYRTISQFTKNIKSRPNLTQVV